MGLRQGVDILTESFETKKYDIVVVGAGGAGLRAAIAAADYGSNVALVTKSLLGKAHTVMAEGGVAAALGNVDKEIIGKFTFAIQLEGVKIWQIGKWQKYMLKKHPKELEN